jgi:hypothetical protein
MANRFPLIVNAVDAKIYELASGENLDLTGNNIFNNGATLTLPTLTGTLATLAGTETFTNKTYSSGALSGTFSGNATLSGTITLSATTALTIPVGTSEQRPTATTGQIRFNSSLTSFEGYNGTAWSSLGGVKSVDGFTFVIAETSSGASNGELEFFVENAAGTNTEKAGGWNTTRLLTNKPIDIAGSSSGVTRVQSTATASGTLTLPAATDTLVGRATTDTLTNKSINLANNTLTATSAQIAAAVTDETGSGSLVFSASPTFTGTANFANITVSGDFTVNGTTTTINSTTLTVDDRNIELGSVASPTDVTADGGGITLKGTTDKTFNWVDATDAWTSSEHLRLAAGKNFILAGSTSGTVTLAVPAAAGTTTITLPATTGTVVTTGDTGTVTSTMIANDTIVNADISPSAAIAVSKLAASTISGVTLGNNLNTLTLNVSGTGLSGSTTYNGSAASTFTVTSNATSANTNSTVVARDASGNFSAGTITAALSGNATTATTLQTARTINTVSFNGSANIVVDPLIQNDDTTNAERFITFVDSSTTGHQRLKEDNNFTYNPSTGTVTSAGGFAAPVSLMSNNITTSYSIPSGYNAISAGPISVASGVSVTIPAGSVWTIV